MGIGRCRKVISFKQAFTIFFVALIYSYYKNEKYYKKNELTTRPYEIIKFMIKAQIFPIIAYFLYYFRVLPSIFTNSDVLGWSVGIIIGYIGITFSYSSYLLSKHGMKISKTNEWKTTSEVEKRLYKMSLMGGDEWHWILALLEIIVCLIGLIYTVMYKNI